VHKLALSRPVSTFIGVTTLALLGAFSLFRLPVSLLPEIERPKLVITARAAGRSQEEMLRGWTERLEHRLSSLPGCASIRSETEDGSGRIVVSTEWQTDADRLRIDAERRLEGAAEFRLDEQNVTVTGGDVSPIVSVAVLGGETGSVRASFARKVLLQELARLPGAGRIETAGFSPLRAVVRPRNASLTARGITASELVLRLESVGRPISAGRVKDGATVRPLLVRESVSSIDELRRIPVPAASGSAPLGELADVTLEEIGDGSSFRWNGQPGALVLVYRAPGANAVALARSIRERVSELSKRASGGIHLEIAADESREVASALRELGLSALAGILLGTLVLRFMLGRWRPTAALSLVIPASLLTSFGAFHLFGVPLDVVSLAGLALAAGMLVDNSIVVLESIETARSRGATDPRLSGTSQIALAVVTSTITTVVVFLPLLYLKGLARVFFGEQAFAVAVSLGGSLLFSLTLTPLLAGKKAQTERGSSPGLAEYRNLLGRLLARPAPAIVLAIGVTLLTLAAAGGLRRELFPAGAGRAIRLRYELPPELSPDEAGRRGSQLEENIRRALGPLTPRSFAALRGLPEESGRGAGEPVIPTHGQIDIEMATPADAREALSSLTRLANSTPGVLLRSAPRSAAFVESVGGGGSKLEIVVTATEERAATPLAQRISALVEKETGLRPHPDEARLPRSTLVLQWDEPRLARLGLDPRRLESEVRESLGPVDSGRIDLAGVEPEIRIEAAKNALLAAFPIGPVGSIDDKNRPGSTSPQYSTTTSPNSASRVVPLSALARFESETRSSRIFRQEGRPAVRLVLGGGPAGARIDALALEKLLGRIHLSSGESATLGGEALEVARSFSQLRLAFILSLILVCLTIAAAYESLVLPALILTTVPVAAGGGFVLLLATGQSLNVMSFIGLILLGGIVVNHTIVLVDRIENLRGAGEKEDDAIRQAAAERYRPIIMTTATTMLGMLPLAILGGEGVELRRALAVTVVGGLFTSTFASLLLVPLLHRLVEPFRRRAVPAQREAA